MRAIDSQVVTLFTSAETSGNGGADHTGGGVVQVDAPGGKANYTGGGINATLVPSSGTAWKFGSQTHSSGQTADHLTVGSYPVTFTAADRKRLRATFPDGVCDYHCPGVGQHAPIGIWLSYGDERTGTTPPTKPR